MRRSGLATTSGSAGTGPGNDTGVWLIMTIILFALLCNYSRTICLIDVGTEGLVVCYLEEFAQRVTAGLEQADWTRRRELIRTLVKRVEIGTEAVQLVFRVEPGPLSTGP